MCLSLILLFGSSALSYHLLEIKSFDVQLPQEGNSCNHVIIFSEVDVHESKKVSELVGIFDRWTKSRKWLKMDWTFGYCFSLKLILFGGLATRPGYSSIRGLRSSCFTSAAGFQCLFRRHLNRGLGIYQPFQYVVFQREVPKDQCGVLLKA